MAQSQTGRLSLVLVALISLLAVGVHQVPGQESGDDSPKQMPSDELALQQSHLADKYQQLEMLMLKMAEFDATSNPRRSALLKRALAQSKEQHIRLQMNQLVKLIQKEQFGRAIDDQGQVKNDLQALLELLLSEDRADRNKDEQDRVREYIKEVDRVLRQHRSVQGRTEGGGDPTRLADLQGKVADRANRLHKLIESNERPGEAKPGEDESGQPSEGQPSEGQPSEGQPSEGQPSEGQPSEGQPSEGQPSEGQPSEGQPSEGQPSEGQPSEGQPSEGQPSEGQPSEGQPSEGQPSEGQPSEGQPSEGQPSEGQPSEGQPSEGQPSEGQPSEGQPSEGQPSEGQPSEGQPSEGQPSEGQPGEEQQPPQQQESFPGQQRVAEAEKRMREAQQRLEEAKRKEAEEEQEEARRLLEQAKAELEEILRQLREEEIERTLAMLESRFRKMLEMQLKVYDDSRRLSQIPLNKRNSQVDIQAGKLSVQERRIAGEADKALLLLREEGSSVAFPEAVEQMHADMLQVADRLSRTRLDRITLGLEEDIIAALEEMVEALQKAQQEAQQRRQQQQQQQGGGQQDQPLVDAIAELKMIRALQMRVNKRTQRYARLLDEPDSIEGQATDDDLLDSLERLSEREQRIRRITRDIVLGKNK